MRCPRSRKGAIFSSIVGPSTIRPSRNVSGRDAPNCDFPKIGELQAEAETTLSSLLPAPHRPYRLRAMKIDHLPAEFVIPAQPIKASRPPSGPDWVHEITHDGYRTIVRRDGPTVRLCNAYDRTVRGGSTGTGRLVRGVEPSRDGRYRDPLCFRPDRA
jgi:hypothetical protein